MRSGAEKRARKGRGEGLMADADLTAVFFRSPPTVPKTISAAAPETVLINRHYRIIALWVTAFRYLVTRISIYDLQIYFIRNRSKKGDITKNGVLYRLNQSLKKRNVLKNQSPGRTCFGEAKQGFRRDFRRLSRDIRKRRGLADVGADGDKKVKQPAAY